MRKWIVTLFCLGMAWIAAALEPSYGPFVPGEEVSLWLPELVGYTAKGLPSGLRLDKKTGEIYGVAKKPTADEGVTVVFTQKDAETLHTQFIVGPIPTVAVLLAGDTEKCKVTGGNKAYLVGKKVTLSARGPRGTAFVGWYRDGEPWPSEDEYLESRVKFTMTSESLALVAAFEKESIAIDAAALESAAFRVGTAVEEGEIVIGVKTQSGLKSLKAAKLPGGLKLAKNKLTDEWSIYGTPKKAGDYEVKLTATANSGAVEILVVGVTVAEKESPSILPEWALGPFEGYVLRDLEYEPDGHVSRINSVLSNAGTALIKTECGDSDDDPFAVPFSCKKQDEKGSVFFLEMTESKKYVYRAIVSQKEIAGVTIGYAEGISYRYGVPREEFSLVEMSGMKKMQDAYGFRFSGTARTDIDLLEYTEWGASLFGYVTIDYGDDGELTASYREESGGIVTDSTEARLLPWAIEGDRLVCKTTIVLRPWLGRPFEIVVTVSLPLDKAVITSEDIILVNTYLHIHG